MENKDYDCIPYLNDLLLEIKVLEDLKLNTTCKVILDSLDKKVIEKKELINKCKENLSKLSNNKICYRLYIHILNGMTPTKAVQKISEENYINGIYPVSVRSIWENYYKKIKKYL